MGALSLGWWSDVLKQGLGDLAREDSNGLCDIRDPEKATASEVRELGDLEEPQIFPLWVYRVIFLENPWTSFPC
jgi:hypothetical protein